MKLFIPSANNGSGDVKQRWHMCMMTQLGGLQIVVSEISDSHANRACNKMCSEFLKTDCEAMFICDADITFSRNQVNRLIAHFERGIHLVYGIYPKKNDAAEPCVCTFADVPLADQHGLAKVRRAARGFMLVGRDVLERMKEDNGGPALRYHNHEQVEWDFFPSGVVRGDFSAMGDGMDKEGYPIREWISEDWYFCEVARSLGIPTLVDTGIALGHVGLKEYVFGPKNLGIKTGAMVKSWQDIHGWFDYESVYRRIVEEVPEGGSFVEVGCWMGKSIAALHAFAQEARKTLSISVVDTFCGESENPMHRAILEQYEGNVRKVFMANMDALSIPVTTITEDSVIGASEFEDGELDAVFIDASHDEQSVRNDILAWRPKVKPGGILAGHDYDEPGVKAAVNEQLQNVETIGRCWWVKV